MAIYWMRTHDLDPDAGYRPDHFTAFDPEVKFPHFHMVEGDETIGNVRLIQGGLQTGKWEWSMTVALSVPAYGAPTNGIEETRSAAARRMIEVYRHYLSTRPEQYPRFQETP